MVVSGLGDVDTAGVESGEAVALAVEGGLAEVHERSISAIAIRPLSVRPRCMSGSIPRTTRQAAWGQTSKTVVMTDSLSVPVCRS
jgi:hypothetical protein